MGWFDCQFFIQALLLLALLLLLYGLPTLPIFHPHTYPIQANPETHFAVTPTPFRKSSRLLRFSSSAPVLL
jgi:hypothetical protein